jgi:preprotein translocase subunit SecA
LTEQLLAAIQAALQSRYERLLGQNGTTGLIIKDIDNQLSKLDGQVHQGHALSLMMAIPQGTRTTFDKRTHRRVQQRTTRLTYIYYTAQLLENVDSEDITEAVLEHLERAQESIGVAWGTAEITRLGSVSLSELSEKSQRGLLLALGEETFTQLQSQPLQTINGETRTLIVTELGRQALTEIYRELLLRVISELWIEYLTQMEALRVAIGLEAYGQRDPLVQYKGRASELFQELLDNIRLGVVTRMFTFRPRSISSAQASLTQADGYENEDELTAEIEAEVEPEIGMEIEADNSQPGDSEGYASEPDDSESEPGPEPATAGESSSKKRSRRRRRRR